MGSRGCACARRDPPQPAACDRVDSVAVDSVAFAGKTLRGRLDNGKTLLWVTQPASRAARPSPARRLQERPVVSR